MRVTSDYNTSLNSWCKPAPRTEQSPHIWEPLTLFLCSATITVVDHGPLHFAMAEIRDPFIGPNFV